MNVDRCSISQSTSDLLIMKEDTLRFQGRIGSYQLTLLANLNTIQFHYYQTSLPDLIYQAFFYKQMQGSTNPAAARLILQTFGNFKRLFKYIEEYSEDQRRISIANAGYVTIVYFKTLTRPKKPKVIEFDGSRLMTTEQLSQQKQVRSDVIDVRAQNTFLKQTLAQLEKEYHSESRQLLILRQQILKNKKNYLRELKEDTKMLGKEQSYRREVKQKLAIHQLQESIQIVKDTLKQLLIKVQQSNKMTLPEPEDTGEDDFQTLQKYGIKHWVIVDTNNKYLLDNFTIQGNVLTKIGIYKSCQVLGRDPFPTSGRHYYSVYINKMTASIFSVGIVSQSRRNHQVSYDSPECIIFYARNGTIWQQGVERGGGPPVPNGVQLRVVVDWVKEMVKWYQDGSQIGSTLMSKHLMDKRLVPYIQMNYVGDQVTWNEGGPGQQKAVKQ